MLHRLETLLRDLVVFPQRMLRNLEATGGLLYSQRIMLVLVGKGVPRPQAYDMVQQAARKVWDEGGHLRESLMADECFARHMGLEELTALFDPAYYLRHIPAIFERAGLPLPDGMSKSLLPGAEDSKSP